MITEGWVVICIYRNEQDTEFVSAYKLFSPNMDDYKLRMMYDLSAKGTGLYPTLDQISTHLVFQQ